jgi:Rieske Fe-S protein
MPAPTHDPHETTARGASRRTLVTGMAAGGLALPLLAACGSGNGGEATGSSGSSDTSSGGAGSGAPSSGRSSGGLTSTSAIPVGGGKIFDKQKVVVTQPSQGQFKAFSAVCTHMGCLVTQVSDGLIQCPCHGSEYSIEDGSVKGGPAPRPLPAEKITVTNGEITLA